jgi:hypothetical protein
MPYFLIIPWSQVRILPGPPIKIRSQAIPAFSFMVCGALLGHSLENNHGERWGLLRFSVACGIKIKE